VRIDCHAHVLPPAYRERLGRLPIPPGRLEEYERVMERYGIERAVVSTGPPGALNGDAGLSRIANDGLAEIARDPRFHALATLPLPDVDAALAELAYALDDLRMDGVMLLSNVGGTYLGDPALEPPMAELDRRGAYVFVHPGFPPYGPPLDHPVWLYEFPFDTVRALANLVYAGALERHPNIRFQIAHLGGAAPMLAHRLASLAAREPELARESPAGAVEYLRRLYYDTGLADNAPALAATLELTSVDHVVFGTDWPYLALPDGDDPAPALQVLGADRAGVDGAHAESLLVMGGP
jgi:predicted TIM-barrel fold metal-dependent hydrolase